MLNRIFACTMALAQRMLVPGWKAADPGSARGLRSGSGNGLRHREAGRRSRHALAALLLLLGGVPQAARANLTVTPTTDVNTLITQLVGSGITVVGTPTLTSVANQSGLFSGGASIGLGIDAGVVLTVGLATDLTKNNTEYRYLYMPETQGDEQIGSLNFSQEPKSPGDADLSAIVGQPTHDAAVLEFQFQIGDGSQPGTVYMNYIFGSDEYINYVGAQYNDVFAFFVDGVNIALVPSTTDAVSIANINPTKNSGYYRNNVPNTNGYPVDAALGTKFAADGLTTVLRASKVIGPGVHTMKFAIADTADGLEDSAIFLQGGSFSNTAKYLVGGTVSGLVGSVTLQNNGGDAFSISTDGSFQFPTALNDYTAYNVTVRTQPALQTCSVTNGSGTLAGADVSNVVVTCASNTAPVAGPMTILTYLDNPVSGFLVGSDADGNPLTYIKVTDPAHGTLTVTNPSTGAATYTPATGYTGSDSFTYKVNDGTADSNVYTVQITVQPTPTTPNLAPLAGTDTYQTLKNVPLVITAPGLLTNDIDPDHQPTTLSIDTLPSSAPAHGTVTAGSGGGFTYTPAANYVGLDSFQYTITDGNRTATGTVGIIVSASNAPPVASDDSYSTPYNLKLTVPGPGLLANDSDPDGNQPLRVVLASLPANGTLTLTSGGGFEYTPVGGTCSADTTETFTYLANDGITNAVTPATVTITVRCTNRAPTATADAYTILKGVSLTVKKPGLLTNDSDPDGDTLTASSVTLPTGAALAAHPDGGFSFFAPTAGTYTFTYAATDGALSSAPATVTVTVTDTNAAPLGASETYQGAKNTPLIVPAPGVLANDIDANGNLLTAVLVTAPQHGSLQLGTDGSLHYLPTSNYVGLDGFTYKAFDGSAYSGDITVGLVIVDTNTPPIAHDDSYTTPQNVTLTVPAPGLLTNDSDVDVGQPLRVVLVTPPAQGTLTLTRGGGFTYTPAANHVGLDSFSYQAYDGQSYSAPVTVKIDVRSAVQPQAIPTLSEWGMIILSSLLALGAALTLRRRGDIGRP
jgi:hypothetical protein